MKSFLFSHTLMNNFHYLKYLNIISFSFSYNINFLILINPFKIYRILNNNLNINRTLLEGIKTINNYCV